MGDEPLVPEYTAPEAFQALADPTRLDILRAIGDAEPRGDPSYIAFSDLRDRVGVSDSGRFSYHLKKLRGTLVERDEDDRYHLTYAGFTVYRMLTRGLFESHDPLDPAGTDGECPDCGAGVSVSHRGDGIVDVVCEACDADVLHYQYPPSGVDDRANDPDDLAMAVDAWARSRLSLFDRGVCPSCGAATEATLTTDHDEVSDRMDDEEAYVRYVCGECGSSPSVTVAVTLQSHPAVIAFLYDHGIDHRERPYWELFGDAAVDVLSTDPASVAVEFPADGETLVVRVDASGDVVDVTRRTEEPPA